MAEKTRGSLIGAVGSILIGAAMLMFVSTIILNSLQDANADNEDSDDLNDTVDQEITTILLGVMGITMIGAAIIGYIGGAFGGA